MLDYMIESLVVILLVVAIFYCFIIDRRLRNFKNKQLEFSPVIDHLNQVTGNTEKVIGVLKDTAHSSNDELKKTISEAKNIADDLSFLVDVSNKISHTLNLQMRQVDLNNHCNFDMGRGDNFIQSNNIRAQNRVNNIHSNIPSAQMQFSSNENIMASTHNNPTGNYYSDDYANLSNPLNNNVNLRQGSQQNNNPKSNLVQNSNHNRQPSEFADDGGQFLNSRSDLRSKDIRQVNSTDYLNKMVDEPKSRVNENFNQPKNRLSAPQITSQEVKNIAQNKTGFLNLLKKVR